MGVCPSFFFFWDAHLLFFFDGRISPRRPSSAHLFFLGRPSSSFFFDGRFFTVFFNPQKIKSACENFVFAFFYIFYGKKIISRTVLIGGGKFGSWTHFFYFSSKFHFFYNLFAHLSPIFFFFEAPIFFKKKRWALFFGAHLPPIFFFSPIFRISLYDQLRIWLEILRSSFMCIFRVFFIFPCQNYILSGSNLEYRQS